MPKIEIAYDNKQITTIPNTKFFGIHVDDKMSWRCHIDYIGSKLSKVCYIMRSTNINTMKRCIILDSTVIQYGLPFWVNSPQSIKIFRIQKSIIRIMMGQRRRDSCRNLFRGLEILPLASQYIFSLMLFVITNRKEFKVNTETYGIKTRQQKTSTNPLQI
jgi:hypothetical protein